MMEAELTSMLKEFYQCTNPQRIYALNQKLIRFQHSNEAWEVAWNLLQTCQDDTVLFFCGNTLAQKIRFKIRDFDEEKQLSLRNAMLDCLKQKAALQPQYSRVVLASIVSCVVQLVMALTPHLWSHPVTHIIENMHLENDPDRSKEVILVLNVLEFLADTYHSYKDLKSRMMAIHASLAADCDKLREYCATVMLHSWPKPDVYNACLGCATIWCQTMHIDFLAHTEFLPRVFDAAMEPQLSDKAVELLSTAFESARHKNARSTVPYFQRLMSMLPPVKEAFMQQDADAMLLHTKLFASVIESYPEALWQPLILVNSSTDGGASCSLSAQEHILTRDVAEALFMVLIECIKASGLRYPTEETSSMLALNVWYTLTETYEELLCEKAELVMSHAGQVFDNLFASFVAAIIPKIAFPRSSEETLDAESMESFLTYRADIMDLLNVMHGFEERTGGVLFLLVEEFEKLMQPYWQVVGSQDGGTVSMEEQGTAMKAVQWELIEAIIHVVSNGLFATFFDIFEGRLRHADADGGEDGESTENQPQNQGHPIPEVHHGLTRFFHLVLRIPNSVLLQNSYLAEGVYLAYSDYSFILTREPQLFKAVMQKIQLILTQPTAGTNPAHDKAQRQMRLFAIRVFVALVKDDAWPACIPVEDVISFLTAQFDPLFQHVKNACVHSCTLQLGSITNNNYHVATSTSTTSINNMNSNSHNATSSSSSSSASPLLTDVRSEERQFSKELFSALGHVAHKAGHMPPVASLFTSVMNELETLMDLSIPLPDDRSAVSNNNAPKSIVSSGIVSPQIRHQVLQFCLVDCVRPALTNCLGLRSPHVIQQQCPWIVHYCNLLLQCFMRSFHRFLTLAATLFVSPTATQQQQQVTVTSQPSNGTTTSTSTGGGAAAATVLHHQQSLVLMTAPEVHTMHEFLNHIVHVHTKLCALEVSTHGQLLHSLSEALPLLVHNLYYLDSVTRVVSAFDKDFHVSTTVALSVTLDAATTNPSLVSSLPNGVLRLAVRLLDTLRLGYFPELSYATACSQVYVSGLFAACVKTLLSTGGVLYLPRERVSQDFRFALFSLSFNLPHTSDTPFVDPLGLLTTCMETLTRSEKVVSTSNGFSQQQQQSTPSSTSASSPPSGAFYQLVQYLMNEHWVLMNAMILLGTSLSGQRNAGPLGNMRTTKVLAKLYKLDTRRQHETLRWLLLGSSGDTGPVIPPNTQTSSSSTPVLRLPSGSVIDAQSVELQRLFIQLDRSAMPGILNGLLSMNKDDIGCGLETLSNVYQTWFLTNLPSVA